MISNPEKLTCVSLIVCERVFRDESTKNLIIVATFNQIIAQAIPCMHPALSVLMTLTNGHGKYNLELRIEHDMTSREVVQMSGPLEINDPLHVGDVHVAFKNVQFPAEGKYWVMVLADNEIIGQRPFWVTKAPNSTA